MEVWEVCRKSGSVRVGVGGGGAVGKCVGVW